MIFSQKCTYWAPGVPDGFGGTSWGEPQVLDCRWQAQQKMIRDKEGLEKVSEAVVYLAQEVNLSGRLYLGESADLTPPEGAKEPQAIGSAVGLGGEIDHWKVWL